VPANDPALAEPAFEVFFAERNRVTLFDDALPALEFLAARYPLVSLSNGNADVNRVGLGAYFQAAITAREFGGLHLPRQPHLAQRGEVMRWCSTWKLSASISRNSVR
jgi:FMN phosphatase YigB (HAD superfamily)